MHPSKIFFVANEIYFMRMEQNGCITSYMNLYLITFYNKLIESIHQNFLKVNRQPTEIVNKIKEK